MKSQENLHLSAYYRNALVACSFGVLFLPASAYANSTTPMSDVICLIVDWFSGNLGAGLATIGITAVGIGAAFGKVSWGLALTVGTGVAVMFGAGDILQQMHVIPQQVC